jgi:hypothetical protein
VYQRKCRDKSEQAYATRRGFGLIAGARRNHFFVTLWVPPLGRGVNRGSPILDSAGMFDRPPFLVRDWHETCCTTLAYRTGIGCREVKPPLDGIAPVSVPIRISRPKTVTILVRTSALDPVYRTRFPGH